MTHIIIIVFFLFIVDIILIAGVLTAMKKEKQYKIWKKNFYLLTKNKNNAHN